MSDTMTLDQLKAAYAAAQTAYNQAQAVISNDLANNITPSADDYWTYLNAQQTMNQYATALQNAGGDINLQDTGNTNTGTETGGSGASIGSTIGQYGSFAMGAPGIINMLKGGNSALALAQANAAQAQLDLQQAKNWMDQNPNGLYSGDSYTSPDELKSYYQQMQDQYQSAEQNVLTVQKNTATSGGLKGFLSGGTFAKIGSAAAVAGSIFGDYEAVKSGKISSMVISSAALFGALYWMSVTYVNQADHLLYLMHITITPHLKLILAAIIAAMVTIIMALIVKSNKSSTTEAGAAAQQFSVDTTPAGNWYDNVPTGAVMFLTSAAGLGAMGITLSPQNLGGTYPVPLTALQLASLTTTLEQDSGMTSAPAGGIYGVPFVQKGANGVDQIIIINPDNTVTVANVTSDGYYVGPNGPDKSYMPMFFPKLDGNGNVVGVEENPNAVAAVDSMTAGLAAANNSAMSAKSRQGSLAFANRSDHSGTYVSAGGSSH